MKIEHFAINVSHPIEMSKWYVEHLGMRIKFQQTEAPFITFLADTSGNVMIEIYRNPADDVPNYQKMDPRQLHLAFVSDTPDNDIKRLTQAGATLYSDDILADGSRLVMLRDPWGFAIQLCKRTHPMLLDQQ